MTLTAEKTISTSEALSRFLKHCEEKGLSPATRETYASTLRYFAKEYPDLPLDTPTIEKFLRVRHETPAHRGPVHKRLQTFYTYLQENEGVQSPVPPKGKTGRPPKYKPAQHPIQTEIVVNPNDLTPKSGQGGLSVSNSTSLSTQEAIEEFLHSRKAAGCTPKSIDDYRRGLKPFAGRNPVLPLTPEAVEDYLSSLEGVAETQWSYWTFLRIFYRFVCARHNLVNPCLAIKRRRPLPKVRKTLTAGQLSKLLALPGTPQEKAIVQLLVESKIRAGELCHLDRDDVFPDHIVVRGKEGERIVPISPATYELLSPLAKSGALFHSRIGRLSVAVLYSIIRGKLKSIGATGMKLGPHILRHSGAVQYLMFGGDTESLRQQLGHTKLETTQIYARMSSEEVKRRFTEVNVLGKLLHNGEATSSPSVAPPTSPGRTSATEPAPAPVKTPPKEPQVRVKTFDGVVIHQGVGKRKDAQLALEV